jgi:3-oxoacyl-[acyl-carrier protein] reductase
MGCRRRDSGGKELAGTGVRVNCVTPAAARTDIFAQMTEAQIDYMRRGLRHLRRRATY